MKIQIVLGISLIMLMIFAFIYAGKQKKLDIAEYPNYKVADSIFSTEMRYTECWIEVAKSKKVIYYGRIHINK